MSASEEELETLWVNILAGLYKQVKWSKIAKNKYSYDVFERRVSAARYQVDVSSVIEKICQSLGIVLPRIEQEIAINSLRESNKQAMRLLRKIPKLLTVRALNQAKES